MRPLFIVCLVLLVTGSASAAPTRQAFSGARQTRYVWSSATGRPEARADGALRLLDGAKDESAAVAFDRTAAGLHGTVEAGWRMRVKPGGNGVSFALLSTKEYGATGSAPAGVAWDGPKLRGSFAVAFDILDPPTQNPFNADGNIYDRPQREVALFWNGAEITRLVSPVEFRTGDWVPARVLLQAVCGGTEVTVTLAGKPVVDRYFIGGMMPYEARAAFGGQTSAATTTADLAGVLVDFRKPMAAPKPPLAVPAIQGEVLKNGVTSASRTVAFPDNTDAYGRILCTLTLAEPPGGYDPWDRSAAVYLYDERGERFELLRFITPYRRGFTWVVDVSDYRPLLRGSKKVEAWCVTYATGWKTSVDFAFYPGKADRYAYRVQNVWSGSPEIGNAEKPVSGFYTPKTLDGDRAADFVKVRMTVTGHGQAPNTDNAAEFLPLRRTLYVNDRPFENLLWKTDNYLNPCRPQGGTWKYDRAGWAPGDVVRPWDVDVTGVVTRGQPIRLRYDLQAYKNESADRGNPPIHWTESQVFYYRRGR